uniref:hypothetical protein n=1 Tax=Cysteiniphilum halobium TaxID=2219059 RepID=UPI003F83E37F
FLCKLKTKAFPYAMQYLPLKKVEHGVKFLFFMADFTLPLDIDSVEIISQTLDVKGTIIFDVVSTRTKTTCHKCGKKRDKACGNKPSDRDPTYLYFKQTSNLKNQVNAL